MLPVYSEKAQYPSRLTGRIRRSWDAEKNWVISAGGDSDSKKFKEGL
jgi:hypothetical protein